MQIMNQSHEALTCLKRKRTTFLTWRRIAFSFSALSVYSDIRVREFVMEQGLSIFISYTEKGGC